jgi:hypothetical protein
LFADTAKPSLESLHKASVENEAVAAVGLHSKIQEHGASLVGIDRRRWHPHLTAVVVAQDPDRERTNALPVFLDRQAEINFSGAVAALRGESPHGLRERCLAAQCNASEVRYRVAAKNSLDGAASNGELKLLSVGTACEQTGES